jgi:Zn-dependent protease with chaperone function
MIDVYTLPPDKLRRAIEYAHARNILHFAAAGYAFLLFLALIDWRVAPRFRDWAERASPRRILQAYVFAPLMLFMIEALMLPAPITGHYLALKFEQSVQSWPSWFRDWAVALLLEIVFATLLIWLLYGIVRRSPRRWWLYFWLASVPIVIFLMFITPVLIDPLFYKFEPLAARHSDLVAQIERVVQRGGLAIPPERMYEMKASEKLKALNASVEGIGASKRVVVWDTTMRAMTTGEILFVFGHEMGHYVLGHNRILIAVTCGVILVFLFAGYHAVNRALRKWGARWGIRGVADWASLPVLLLTLGIFSFLSEPVLNSLSRKLEHDADVYGLEVIHGIVPDSPHVAAKAFQILGEISLSDPDPSRFIKFWLYDHPSVSDRVRFASEYDPWDEGQPLRYLK